MKLNASPSETLSLSCRDFLIFEAAVFCDFIIFSLKLEVKWKGTKMLRKENVNLTESLDSQGKSLESVFLSPQ